RGLGRGESRPGDPGRSRGRVRPRQAALPQAPPDRRSRIEAACRSSVYDALVAELHPLVLDFAVALLLVAPVCDVLGLVTHREALLWTGRWNTLIGAVAAALSVLTGLAAE